MMKKLSIKLFSLLLCFTLLIPTLASAHTVGIKSPAADLRSALGQLLGEHALLAVLAMQKGIDGQADFTETANALNENTTALTNAIESVYGKDAGTAFNGLWKTHIGFFVDYVTSTAKKDEAGRKAALMKLDQYRFDFAKFLSSANANFDAAALADALQSHVAQLVSAFDSYVNKDYTTAYKSIREAYAHMFMTGDYLAAGITAQFPDKFTSTTSAKPASDLRSAVDRLLGEHAALAVIAMQKGISGAPDFAEAAAALGANTTDLSAAITSVYGADAGKAFNSLWTTHIGFFVDYVTSTAKKDEAGRQAAVNKLNQYGTDFGAFLNSANPDNFKTADIAGVLKGHVEQLITAFDSYVSKDYPTAYKNLRDAYAHMFMTGDYLAAGIVAQFPDKFHGPKPEAMETVVGMKIGSKSLTLNGTASQMDVAPFNKDGLTYIPLRYLAEGIGATVTWDAATQTAWVKLGSNTLSFWVGKTAADMNGMSKDLGAAVWIKDSRTVVPLRAIAELLGWTVEWNAKDNSITLKQSMIPAPAMETNMDPMMH